MVKGIIRVIEVLIVIKKEINCYQKAINLRTCKESEEGRIIVALLFNISIYINNRELKEVR